MRPRSAGVSVAIADAIDCATSPKPIAPHAKAHRRMYERLWRRYMMWRTVARSRASAAFASWESTGNVIFAIYDVFVLYSNGTDSDLVVAIAWLRPPPPGLLFFGVKTAWRMPLRPTGTWGGIG